MDQWKRFVYYAQYVRILRAHGSDSFAILAAITFRPSSLKNELIYFFPRCQYLHWCATRKQIGAVNLDTLIPPTLDHVFLFGNYVDRIWFNKFCEILLNGLSSLRALHIDHSPLIERAKRSDSFYSLLKKFAPTLTSIQIPEILFTKATIGKLSEVGGLCDLVVQECRYLEKPVLIMEHAATRVNDKSGNFSSLKSLSLGPFMDELYISKFFWRFSFPALRSFRWHISDTAFNADAFFATIVQTCPSLEILELGTWNIIESDKKVSWSSVQSLLSCTKLVTLSLLCFRVDHMTLDNLVELLKSRKAPLSWRKLEILTCQPFYFQDALLLIAKYSPGIHRLGLRVHDKDGVRPFGNIVPEKVLLPPFRNNVQARLELADQLRQTGFFFPSLTIVLFDNSVFMPDSEGLVASLLLALCQNQVKVVGDDWAFFAQVTDHMAAYYEEMEKLTKETTSIEAKLDSHLCK